MIELFDKENLSRITSTLEITEEDLDVFLQLRYSNSILPSFYVNDEEFILSLIEQIRFEDKERGRVVRKFWCGATYPKVLAEIYEHVGDRHYRSRYLKHRLDCPYFAYCSLATLINGSYKGNSWLYSGFYDINFPSPYEVFRKECACIFCNIRCDICEKEEQTFNTGFVVHHKDYYTPPNSKSNWHNSYGILCRSCNNKKENLVEPGYQYLEKSSFRIEWDRNHLIENSDKELK